MLRIVTVLLLLALPACGPRSSGPPADEPAPKILLATDDDGLAIGGHDPVAYHTAGAAVTGTEALEVEHEGATYWFADEEHRTDFVTDPDRYLPAYGGYCAFAASQGRLTPADPAVFEIVGGELLLFANAGFHESFMADPQALKAEADRNWPALVEEHGVAP